MTVIQTTQYKSNAGRLFNSAEDALRDDCKETLKGILAGDFATREKLGLELTQDVIYDAIVERCDAPRESGPLSGEGASRSDRSVWREVRGMLRERRSQARV